MSEDNVRLTGSEITRWVILAILLVASLAAYFIYSPRVPSAIRPPVPVVEQ
jgi:hypothetical protein